MASQLKLQGASVPEGALSLARWNPVLLQQRVSNLEGGMLVSALLLPFGYFIKLLLTLTLLLDCFLPDMARQYSILEEKHSQS
jgi:hypothetical protein